MRLILIRHGQTKANLEKRYSGSLDTGLTEKGRQQVRCLRQRLKKEGADKVYSSDRKRAIETAMIIFGGKKIERMADLREMHFGVFEGLKLQEIAKKYPQVYKKWLRDPFNTVIPKGEDIGRFKKRVIKALGKIISLNKGRTAAVVSHGGVISIFICYLLKSKNFWSQLLPPASFKIIKFRDSDG